MRTTYLRKLADQFHGTDFEINFSDVTVLFRPDDPNGDAFSNAVHNYDRKITVRRSLNGEWERFSLSLG